MKPLMQPKLLTVICLIVVLPLLSLAQTRFISFGSSWRYLDNNTRPSGWETTNYDDGTWSLGNAEFGYGDGDETTIVSFGPDPNNKYVTTYFRKTVNIPDPATIANFIFNIERDDAFVLYVNGSEVARNNMPAGLPDHNSFALAVANDSIVSVVVPNTAFAPTYNVIALELHQANLTSSDLSFDLEMIGSSNTGAILFNNDEYWRYLDTNARPANWQTTAFADGGWRIGYAELGFGEGDEATIINGGPSNARYPATYFRRIFTVADSAAYPFYSISVTRDDGYVLYLNGTEIGRNNMPAGTPLHTSFASANVEEEIITFMIPASLLRTGSNLLAAEVHQSNATSTDLSFNVKITGVAVSSQKIIAFGSSWKYLDNDTRPAGWETSSFDDAAWSSGNGEFGFGDSDEGTTINGGPGSARFITTYFRKTINIANPAAFPAYTFNIERDDAFVVYVNGNEVGRNNMPAGTPAHGTLALAGLEDLMVTFSVPSSVFVAGNNTIAVEIHQNGITSSDLSFDLELTGNSSSNILIGNNASWKYWNANSRPALWPNSADAAWPIGNSELGFGDGDETTVVDGGPAGNRWPAMYFRKTINIDDVNAFTDYTFTVKRDDGFVLYVNGTERARNNYTGTPAHNFNATNTDDSLITFTLPASNFQNGSNAIAVEIHQSNANSSDLSFDLQLFGNFSNQPIIPFNSAWKYLDNNTRPAGWETVAFNDAGWPSGNARLGYGGDGEATVVAFGPDPNNKYPTTYFRKSVNIANASAYANFNIGLVRDDGAVVYVNGVEVIRSNMPVPPVTHTTLAASNVGGAAETAVNNFVVPASYFVNGNNVIAVEVHQDLLNSSDLGFNLQLTTGALAGSSPAIINYTDVWRFLDNGSDQGTTWRNPAFDDAAWNSGAAKLGYGGDGETTVIGFGPDANNKYITSYFRKTVTINNLNQFQSFIINLLRDDGAVIYVNGNEIVRENMPAGAITYQTLAASTIDEGTEEDNPVSYSIPITHFVEGTNTIAVEIHQVNATSSDLGFAMELLGSQQPAGSATLTRAPYLQRGTQNEITIRWRTATASDSRVELGSSVGNYTILVDSPSLTTEHIVRVTGLTPDTKYFYRIGSTTQVLQGAADNFFTTLPAAGTRKVRIAAFGDCGRNENNFQANTLTRYRNYLSSNGIDAADAWILLGDNAYNSGTETEYNNAFFNIYGPSILKNHKLYPAPGNHDYYADANGQANKNVPYYSLFTMPTNGEAGGVPSNTKAFYSFDVGDIHFLSLDSYGTEIEGINNRRLYDTTGPQVNWIKADLAANTKKWVVAYWHHPPYTKGSHNSDTEGELVSMRENFIRILERNGVDMIICGHSHDYERSYLLKGYYKANPGDPQLNENDFNSATHAVSTSSAKYDGTANSCPYIYKHGQYNHGTVYVVSGNSGADGGVQSGYPHNALPFADQNLGGMFYFEADSNRLDAKYIRTDGSIGDNFTVMKGVNTADTFFIVAGNQVTLSASWSGNYAWNNAANTRTISVTPPEGLSNYSVTDNQGCLKDSFAVYANICTGNINTWVGNISTAWENPGNWSCGQVPGINSEVVINPGTPYSAIVSSDVVIKNITIKTGASVTVVSGFKLDVKEPNRP